MNKPRTITIRTSAKLYNEIERLAFIQRRTMSNMGEYLLLMGKLKYAEEEERAARQKGKQS